jgi:hypothetical protein
VGEQAAVPGRTIVIPEDVAKALEARVSRSAFPTIDAFVAYVLVRLTDHPVEEPFSEEEERRLRERLRSLGYID